MVLVIDHAYTLRAKALRERILKLGFPCAMLPVRLCRHFAPAFCIVTYTDVLDDVRHEPLDEIPAYVLGEGFVNSALNAKAVREEETLYDLIKARVLECLGTKEESIACFLGYTIRPGFTLVPGCIYYHSLPIVLAKREYRILQYLLFDPDGYHSYHQIQAYTYPMPYRRDVRNTLHAHISHINKVAMESTGRKLIRYRYGKGYTIQIRGALPRKKFSS